MRDVFILVLGNYMNNRIRSDQGKLPAPKYPTQLKEVCSNPRLGLNVSWAQCHLRLQGFARNPGMLLLPPTLHVPGQDPRVLGCIAQQLTS